jgi:pSer/pThr/pTyr-binding forkhead associated (FHA) protein
MKKSNVDFFGFLVCISPNGMVPGNTFPLDSSVTRIGKSGSNEIKIHYDKISDTHAKIIFDDESKEFFIQNYSELNDTYVNGNKINKLILKDNDNIKLGNDVEVIFKRAW